METNLTTTLPCLALHRIPHLAAIHITHILERSPQLIPNTLPTLVFNFLLALLVSPLALEG